MWRGFGAESDTPETQRSYFRPRISSISGVLAMTKQRLFSPPVVIKDEMESHASPHAAPSSSYSSSVNPVGIESYGLDSRINGMCLTGGGGGLKAPSPRSSYGDIMAYSFSASARPSIDSTTAHAVYTGEHLGMPEQSDTEVGDNVKCSHRTRKIVCGIVCTILIALSWVGVLHLLKICFNTRLIIEETPHVTPLPSNISQSPIPSPMKLYPENSNSLVFDAPFFATWYSAIWNILFFPIYLFSHILCCNNDQSSAKKLIVESVQQYMDKGFTALQFFYRCGFFYMLWMLSNYMLIYSLRILDTTVVMALYCTTVSIVYLLSWVVLHQQFVGARIVAMIICDTGIALLAYMDGVQEHTVLGCVIIAFGSAIGSAVYKVFFKRMIGYTTFAQMALFFSLVGLMNVFLSWPIILLLYFVSAETIIWSQIPWLPLSGAAALTLFANILGNFGVVCTYEVFLTLGLLLAIPISLVIDVLVYHVTFEEMKLAGIILILFGFVVVLLPDNWNEYLGDILRRRITQWKRREQMKKNGRVQDTSTGHLSRLRTPSGRIK